MPVQATDKIQCQTPSGGKPVRIDRWKYETIREAILAVLAEHQEIAFSQLSQNVRTRLDADTINRLGSISWYVTTVKLHLETQGEIARAPGSGPQRLQLRNSS